MDESKNATVPRRSWRTRRPPAEPPRAPLHPVLRGLAMLLAFAGTVLFSLALARVTLEPSAASVDLVHSNVRPGASINAYLDGASVKDAVKQLGGNVLLGVPFGLLLPVLLPQTRGLLRVTLPTALVMTLVELVQGALVSGRAFDVDDVILNTAGALLGYLLLGRRMSRAVHPRRSHWWHRWTRRAAAPVQEPVHEPVREPVRAPVPAAAPAAAGATGAAAPASDGLTRRMARLRLPRRRGAGEPRG
ncbi:VanZ family protein [Streptomyces sp. NPDC088097]|uniref:VanZ family protein n=1 Tax=Streptomyces sp. NPDC088097 TaxID=3365823 RepID=UPI0037FB5786